MNDPVLWIMSVCSAQIQSASVSNGLDHSNVISTIEMLQQKIKINIWPINFKQSEAYNFVNIHFVM